MRSSAAAAAAGSWRRRSRIGQRATQPDALPPGRKPILYVSRGPWSLYEVLDEVFAINDIPIGSILLVGDSGQCDPEIYARIVDEHPGRAMAVSIRDVSRDSGRSAALAELSVRLTEAGSELVLAQDSLALARHAAARGWVTAGHCAEVAAAVAGRPAGAGAGPVSR